MKIVRKYLVIGIVVLFVGANFLPSISGNSITSFEPMNLGNWLYVGGSEEGNYTKIQDAVDNASPGDKIFVYNGLYNENLFIETNRLSLIGEDKELTIISGNGNQHTIEIELTKNVTITGFSITTKSNLSEFAGIFINTNINTLIQNNLIFENGQGIKCIDTISFNISNNNIFNNTKHNSWIFSVGIDISGGKSWIIRKNRVYENEIGVKIWDVQTPFLEESSYIECNKITDNYRYGLDIYSCCFIITRRNEISHNPTGILIEGYCDPGISFYLNNIINNNLSVQFISNSFTLIFNNIVSDSDILIASTRFAPNRNCYLNYWGSKVWPRRKCQPIFLPVLLAPWLLKPVEIPQCWPE